MVVEEKSLERFFCRKKNRNAFSIGEKSIYPSKLTMLDNDFVRSYSLQIEKLLFTDKKEINIVELSPILIIVEMIIKKETPIYLEHNLGPKYSNMIIDVLNKFVNENLDLLKVIYKNVTNNVIEDL